MFFNTSQDVVTSPRSALSPTASHFNLASPECVKSFLLLLNVDGQLFSRDSMFYFGFALNVPSHHGAVVLMVLERACYS